MDMNVSLLLRYLVPGDLIFCPYFFQHFYIIILCVWFVCLLFWSVCMSVHHLCALSLQSPEVDAGSIGFTYIWW